MAQAHCPAGTGTRKPCGVPALSQPGDGAAMRSRDCAGASKLAKAHARALPGRSPRDGLLVVEARASPPLHGRVQAAFFQLNARTVARRSGAFMGEQAARTVG